ncbi:MAG: Hsp33 family molecular chaperone HslO [Moraxellaceae bacterium]|nr:Hsp33 family molecular chaperone HslO [Moraxellaceae bacterium]
MSDFIQRFHFSESPVRGELVQLSASVDAAFERHQYPDAVARLLGEAMAATVLLASTLKFEGSLILQARGDGPLETLMVECNHRREVRAIAQPGEAWQEDMANWPLEQLFGNGQLAITIDPEGGQRYQGIVPLQGTRLESCLEHYFMQSEQLPTRIWLAASEEGAAGLLLQVLPGHDQGSDADIWPRLQQLTATVKADELLELPATELLYRLYNEELVELHEAQAVCFRCTCSRERTEQVLVTLGENELRGIIAEHGAIEISCQFCGQEYAFDPVDVEQMIRGGAGHSVKMH